MSARHRCYRCKRRRACCVEVKGQGQFWQVLCEFWRCPEDCGPVHVCPCCGDTVLPNSLYGLRRASTGREVCAACRSAVQEVFADDPTAYADRALRVATERPSEAFCARVTLLFRATDRLQWRAERFEGWPVREHPAALRELRAELRRARSRGGVLR